jgi:RNA polymerase sigma-70 factor (ECF subfamily)
MNIPLYSDVSYDDEISLVQGCREHRAQAQKKLYDRYVDVLMVVCLRYIGNQEDAKDTLMKAFVESFRCINSFEYRGVGSLRAWLKSIAVHQCLMHLRKQPLLFQPWDDRLEEYVEDKNSQQPLVQLTVKEIMHWIHELPAGYKTVFNLYVFEDMGHKEIAALLDISENTSKSQLHKARALLQKQILSFQNSAL